MNLLEERNKAWKEFSDFDGLEWHPRLYKRWKGQGKVTINPFASMEEYHSLAAKRRELWREFLRCQFAVYDAGLSTELEVHWIKEDTPDGERWRRIA